MELQEKDFFLYENKSWKVLLSENQYYLGRCFVIFKGNAVHLSELSKEEFFELQKIIKLLERSLQQLFNATHFNWTCLMNDYYKPKNRDKQKELHLHLWPRYDHPVTFESETFVDEVFGHHYDKTKEKDVPNNVLLKLVATLKHEINKEEA